MITVDFTVRGAEIMPSQPPLASGSAGIVRARFFADGAWAGLTCTAVFRTPRGDILMPLCGMQCDFPAEATASAGGVYVGLFGTDGARTLTTGFCRVQLASGVPTSGADAENYTPSLYEQFAARFAAVENMTAAAVTGDTAAVSIDRSGAALHLQFTLPKGDPYTLTEADKAEINAYTDEKLGSVEEALDVILALQESYIGGEGA